MSPPTPFESNLFVTSSKKKIPSISIVFFLFFVFFLQNAAVPLMRLDAMGGVLHFVGGASSALPYVATNYRVTNTGFFLYAYKAESASLEPRAIFSCSLIEHAHRHLLLWPDDNAQLKKPGPWCIVHARAPCFIPRRCSRLTVSPCWLQSNEKTIGPRHAPRSKSVADNKDLYLTRL